MKLKKTGGVGQAFLYLMADRGFENKQRWIKGRKISPLLAILSEGPQKKFL
jgi:hypothetical protein